MIISTNNKPTLEEFKSLMSRLDEELNKDALLRKDYYSKRNGVLLEDDVLLALNKCSVGTSFENTIVKVSGQKFPDIIACQYYGVEVKSTKDDNWKSTGGSIMETTRVDNVDRIYMTFGKLGGDTILFKSKPYEDCLYDIAVTHMPRYLINMELEEGQTIFDKIGIPYDVLRRMDNPITPVANYYRSKLRPGESLWWADNNVEEVVPAKMRLWSNLEIDEKKHYAAYALCNFPEVICGNYDRYSLWLASQGIVDPHLRDQFSAGGREQMMMSNKTYESFPAVYRRVKNYKDSIINCLSTKSPLPTGENRITGNDLSWRIILWCDKVSELSTVNTDMSLDALSMFFLNQPAEEVKRRL